MSLDPLERGLTMSSAGAHGTAQCGLTLGAISPFGLSLKAIDEQRNHFADDVSPDGGRFSFIARYPCRHPARLPVRSSRRSRQRRRRNVSARFGIGNSTRLKLH
ncbi:hypothetical protein MAV_5041 [Mycobacterium avium 104]|uniref:Uncharacterized protein n=1 Tax=Mycobacterium avium (strain 104) TaxID=243243 RepID=A0A0H2ZWY5_MYCA1|nr:hypothetical protein MAV_5041 [Mycobacterium avium 104]